MSTQGDIRKFCLQGGDDLEEKDKEQAQREKRKLQQQSYNKKNRKRNIIETWVEEYDWVGTVHCFVKYVVLELRLMVLILWNTIPQKAL